MSKKRVENSQKLPIPVVEAINEIMDHRKIFRMNAKIYGMTTIAMIGLMEVIAASSVIWDGKVDWPMMKMMPVMGLPIISGIDIMLYRSHLPRFKKEYLKLYRALDLSKNNPSVHKILSQGSTNYIGINSRGELVPKKTNLSFFGQPIGQRAIPNPLQLKSMQWRKSIPNGNRKRKK